MWMIIFWVLKFQWEQQCMSGSFLWVSISFLIIGISTGEAVDEYTFFSWMTISFLSLKFQWEENSGWVSFLWMSVSFSSLNFNEKNQWLSIYIRCGWVFSIHHSNFNENKSGWVYIFLWVSISFISLNFQWGKWMSISFLLDEYFFLIDISLRENCGWSYRFFAAEYIFISHRNSNGRNEWMSRSLGGRSISLCLLKFQWGQRWTNTCFADGYLLF